MNYLKYTIHCADAAHSDLLVAELAELGCDSFSEFSADAGTIDAYVPESEGTARAAAEFLSTAGLTYERSVIEAKNWNALWESNFEPILVDERCYIRATFHEPKECEYEIVITPKMSFGTGHHPTTHLMVQSLLDSDLTGLRGLDMGSGTGVLAIMAVRRGAVHVDAVDIDEWAYENCEENIVMNDVGAAVRPLMGDVGVIEGKTYDFILANINRNVLLADMTAYVESLSGGGSLIMSGFLEADADAIRERAEWLGLTLIGTLTREGWVAMKFVNR